MTEPAIRLEGVRKSFDDLEQQYLADYLDVPTISST